MASGALLRALECSACPEYVSPPITACEGGHSVCSGCRPRLHRCPACRRGLTAARNPALEELARTAVYPCREGCGEARGSPDDMARHHARCALRRLPCPLSCPWEGPRSGLRAHVLAAHPGNTLDLDDDPGAPFVAWDLPGAVSYRDSSQVVFCLGEVFLLDRRFDDARKKWLVALRLVGAACDAGGFRYKLKMSCAGGRRASFTDAPRPAREDLREVLESARCVAVDFDLLLHFVKGVRSIKIWRVGGSVTEL
ncbi:E3 ubiquitin-protein ligase Siah1-like [Bacillus rossius redtenbacheri]|uniref:E3 ubiquitin-protein ligase Siah1-like n=1 Tax=Bacillus rossius redtenbacheri TaxID=93214 RepID=UPI002FDCAB02